MDRRPLHKGWHSRGYLPHLDAPGELQALTFRLADSLPRKVIECWKRELQGTKGGDLQLRRQIAVYEDAGHGSCLLGCDDHAATVQEALLHGDGNHYRLLEWCIMPNHVHVLIACLPGASLGDIVRRWKTYTAHAIHRKRGSAGNVWAEDYHDRYIRDLDHFHDARAYIRNNPVRAKLCASPAEWRWGSAAYRERVD